MFRSSMRATILGCAIATVAGSAAFWMSPVPPGDLYTGIRGDAGFPADREMLEHICKTEDVAKMRAHAWWVWSLINEETDRVGAEDPRPPRWRTWYSDMDTYRQEETGAESLSTSVRSIRLVDQAFEVPVQLREPEKPEPGEGIESLANSAVGGMKIELGAKVFFNAIAKDHIRTHGYHLADRLNRLSNEHKESIEKFPSGSVVLKSMWWRVRKEGSQVPVWDFDVKPVWDKPVWEEDRAKRRTEIDNLVGTWTRMVKVVPDQGVQSGNPTVPEGVEAVPLSRFYSVPIAAEDVERLKQVLKENDLKEGDYLVLVAMHVVTKELPDWVWATFWWHDKPDQGPYARDRPDSVTGVWRNYLMDTTMNKVYPREFDGSYNVCYNPWLEGTRYAGFISNCIRCHQHAKWHGGERVDLFRIGQHSAQNPELKAGYEDRLDLDYIMSMVPRHKE